jgi:hypothetical protein
MDAVPRLDVRTLLLVVATGVVSLTAVGCGGASPFAATVAPSPVIVPDAVTVVAGGAQVFSVENATVTRFDLAVDGQRWSECLTIDPAFVDANRIRLVAYARCQGLVYVSAAIGVGRSPLVAVMRVQ